METEEEGKKDLMVSQIDEVSLLLGKVRALATVLKQASEATHVYLGSHTVMTATTDMIESLDKIKAIIKF